MLVFERHTGCLLAARLRPGNASSHPRILPMLLRLVPRLQSAFPGVKIKLRGDAGFAFPLLYQFCEFFDLEYAVGIPANCVFQERAQPRQKQLKRRYRRTQVPQRSFSSFPHRARSWPRQRRICYKAEHTVTGTNLRFLITNCTGSEPAVRAEPCSNPLSLRSRLRTLPNKPYDLADFALHQRLIAPFRKQISALVN